MSTLNIARFCAKHSLRASSLSKVRSCAFTLSAFRTVRHYYCTNHHNHRKKYEFDVWRSGQDASRTMKYKNTYHFVRKCKDRLFVHINTQTFLTFPDSAI